jgi:hypothetical protein
MKCNICGKDFPIVSGNKNKGRPFALHSRWHDETFRSKIMDCVSWRSRDERNKNWKGESAGYCAIHTYVKLRKQKPKSCEFCHQNKKLDLANKSGKYKRDLDDWYWLCRKCHQDFDGYTLKLQQRKVPMDYEKIRRMYVEEKKSGYVIAKELGLSVKLLYTNCISPIRKELQIDRHKDYCQIKIPYKRGCADEM